MHRKFIAIVLGAALAVTGLSSAPVRAQDRGETAAIIAGVAALAIIGAAVSNDRKKDRRKDYVTRGYGHNFHHDHRYYKQKRHYKHKRHAKQKRHHKQKWHADQKRHYRQDRHQTRQTHNRVYRGHQAHQNTQHRADHYTDRLRHRRDQDRK